MAEQSSVLDGNQLIQIRSVNSGVQTDETARKPTTTSEPLSVVERYVGRRWSLAIVTGLLIIVMVQYNQKDIALLLAGGFVGVLGSLFPQYAQEKKG
jgi:hypothetical protein